MEERLNVLISIFNQLYFTHYICAALALSKTHLLRVRVGRRLYLRGHRGLGLGLLHPLPRPARLPGHERGAEEREEEEAGEVRPHGVRITSPPGSRRKQEAVASVLPALPPCPV